MFKILLFLLIIISCTGCDQVTKVLARQQLMNKPELSYLHDTVRLMYVENTGAAYSLGEDLKGIPGFLVLCALPLFILGVVCYYLAKNYERVPVAEVVALSLIFAGGIGNLFDRIFNHRHVTDFIYMSAGSLHTGIFNMADVFLTIGVGVMIVLYFVTRFGKHAHPETN